jgi:geranylgeranyl pyrophosphate synthase
LLDLLCRRSSDHDTVSEAISLVRESGALEESRGHARRIFEEGWSSYSELVPESGKKAMLRELCDALIGSPDGT